MIYLATPYSHPDPKVQVQRFEQAAQCAARLINSGYIVYCPITHTHPISLYTGDGSWEAWRRLDTWYLERCRAMLVVKMPGWEESAGIHGETKMCLDLLKQVVFTEVGYEVLALKESGVEP